MTCRQGRTQGTRDEPLQEATIAPKSLFERVNTRYGRLRTSREPATGLEATLLEGAAAADPTAAARALQKRLPDSLTAFRDVDLAEVAHRLDANDRTLPRHHLVAFEAIVLDARSPVFGIEDDRPIFDDVSLQACAPRVRKALEATDPADWAAAARAVARIDAPQVAGRQIGSGFLVGDGLMLTNRHVAEAFAWGEGHDARMSTDLAVEAVFGFEDADDPGPTARVVGVAWIHPYWDAALLRVDGDALAGRSPLAFSDADPNQIDLVAAIGYPAFHRTWTDYDDIQRLIFGDRFNLKRFQPGVFRGYAATDVPSPRGLVERVVIRHDASTLPGSSGSALFALDGRRLVGLHFAGDPQEANYAVSCLDLLREEIVRATVGGVAPPPAARAAAPAEAAHAPAASPVPPAPERSRPIRDALGAAWFLSPSESALRALWADPAQRPEITDELERTLGRDAAEAWIVSLDEASVERAGGPAGVVVFVHGIMGSHLVRESSGDRAWLDPLEILFGRVDRALTLTSDGTEDRLHPAGHLEPFYGTAARTWRSRGLRVVPFAYDWRLGLEQAAVRLDAAIDTVRRTFTDVGITLAAHSMGGLVAAVWAKRNEARFHEQISAVVLAGSPLGGSYAPMEAVVGTYALLRALAAAATRTTRDHLRSMAATFPGMVDLLPDPELFPEAADLYDQPWGRLTPAAPLIRQARAVKGLVSGSPLLRRAFAFVADHEPTVAGHVREDGAFRPGTREPGDGTVPVRSATRHLDPSRVFVVRAGHGSLFTDRDVIDGVDAIARGAPLPERLVRWTGPAPLRADGSSIEAAGDAAEAAGVAFRVALQEGRATAAHVLALWGDPPAQADVENSCADAEWTPPRVESAAGGLEPSGRPWVDRYPTDRTTAGLVQPFRRQVQAFILALEAALSPDGVRAGVTVRIHATRRPRERALLMRGAWDIVREGVAPGSVSTPEVPIDWTHRGDDAAAIRGAREMFDAFGLAFRPARSSRHIEGLAIDLTLDWSGVVVVRDAKGISIPIDAALGRADNEALMAVGASYGVHHLRGDPPHWSVDGR